MGIERLEELPVARHGRSEERDLLTAVRDAASTLASTSADVDHDVVSELSWAYERLAARDLLSSEDYLLWAALLRRVGSTVRAADVLRQGVDRIAGDAKDYHPELERRAVEANLDPVVGRAEWSTNVVLRAWDAATDPASWSHALELVSDLERTGVEAPIEMNRFLDVRSTLARRDDRPPRESWPVLVRAADVLLDRRDRRSPNAESRGDTQVILRLLGLADDHGSVAELRDVDEPVRSEALWRGVVALVAGPAGHSPDDAVRALRLWTHLERSVRTHPPVVIVGAEILRTVGRLAEARATLLSIDSAHPAIAADDQKLWQSMRDRTLGEIAYQTGDFAAYWRGVRDGSREALDRLRADDSGLLEPRAAELVAQDLRYRSRIVGLRDATVVAHALVRLVMSDDVPDDVALQGVVDLRWLAERWDTVELHQRATAVGTDLIARLRNTLVLGTRTPVYVLPRIAFLAIVGKNDAIAHDALNQLPREPDEPWQTQLLRCYLDIARHPHRAHELARTVAAARPWDLDVRTAQIHTAIFAGQLDEAIREARSVCDFAPGHIHSKLLLAEALLRSADKARRAGERATVGRGHSAATELYAQAAQHFSEVLELHNRLEGACRVPSKVEAPSSDFLAANAVRRVSQRGLYALLWARQGLTPVRFLARRGLHDERRVLMEGLAQAQRLKARGKHERKALVIARTRQAVGKFSPLALRILSIGIAAVCAIGVVRPDLLTGVGVVPAGDKAQGALRPYLAGAGIVALFWPYLSKFSFAGLAVERLPVIRDVAIDPVNELDSGILGFTLFRPEVDPHGDGPPGGPFPGGPGPAGADQQGAARAAGDLGADGPERRRRTAAPAEGAEGLGRGSGVGDSTV